MPTNALVLGVPPKVRPAVAAAKFPSSVPDVIGRKSTPESLWGGRPGEKTESTKEEEVADLYDREKPVLLALYRLDSGTWYASLIGGGVVSTELTSSAISEEPEYIGDAEEASLGSMCGTSMSGRSVVLSAFMLHRTDAASSN